MFNSGSHCSEVQLCPAFSQSDHLIFFWILSVSQFPFWPQLIQVGFLTLATCVLMDTWLRRDICRSYRHEIFPGLVLCAWQSSQLQGHGSGGGAERLCSKIWGIARTHLERTGMYSERCAGTPSCHLALRLRLEGEHKYLQISEKRLPDVVNLSKVN